VTPVKAKHEFAGLKYFSLVDVKNTMFLEHICGMRVIDGFCSNMDGYFLQGHQVRKACYIIWGPNLH